MSINFLDGSNFYHSGLSHQVSTGLEQKVNKKDEDLPLKIAKTAFVLSLIVILFLYLPSLWFYFNGYEGLSEIIGRRFEKRAPTVESPVKETYQPRMDSSLPFEASISIASIGVDSSLVEATYESYEEALKEGIWRVPDFGTPYDRSSPTILAAHRYGYLAWSNIFRRKNSFYNLPKLEVGDTIEIVWRQRKYIYEVYGEGEGEEIADYSADLILYTCEDLNSPIRIFKYARLLEL